MSTCPQCGGALADGVPCPKCGSPSVATTTNRIVVGLIAVVLLIGAIVIGRWL